AAGDARRHRDAHRAPLRRAAGHRVVPRRHRLLDRAVAPGHHGQGQRTPNTEPRTPNREPRTPNREPRTPNLEPGYGVDAREPGRSAARADLAPGARGLRGDAQQGPADVHGPPARAGRGTGADVQGVPRPDVHEPLADAPRRPADWRA